MPQSFTTRDTEVIMRARRKRRAVLVLREDSDWLREFHPRPKDLLLRMAGRGALIKLGAGRYAIPTLGSDAAAYNAWQPMLHGRLAPLGDYYLGFFSALEEHRLSDLSEPFTTVLVRFASRQLMSGKLEVAGRPLRAARTRRLVFTGDLGVEVVRLSRTERYLRSNPTRTLVDCLWHPHSAARRKHGSVPGAAVCARSALDPLAACRYALALGPTVARRTGLMLDLLGAGEVARAELPGRVRRSDRAFRPCSPTAPRRMRSMEIDQFWRVRMNVSRDRLEGWLSYGK